MNYFLFSIAMFVPVICVADELVQPATLPSSVAIPGLASNLVTQHQQKRDEKTLLQISTAMTQALNKQEKKQKKSSAQKKSPLLPNNGTSPIRTDEQWLPLTTEFLQAKEFITPVSITTKKISIRDAILVLAKQAQMTILVDHGIQGFIPSLQATQVPIGALLQLLFDAHTPALGIIRIANTWRVAIKTRTEELARVLQQTSISTDRSHEKIIITHATWDDRFKKTVQDLWKDIVGTTKDTQETYLAFDDINNYLFVCGRATHIQKFKSVVTTMDKPAPQVRLEMRIICADKNFESDFGLQWSGLYDRRNWAGKFGLAGFGLGDITPASPAGGGAPAPAPLKTLHAINTTNQPANAGVFKNLLGWTLNTLPVSIANKAANTLSLPITFGGRNLEWGRLNLQLMAAEENREIKTILKPNLLVNNQETAEILVGQQLPHKTTAQDTVQGAIVNATSTSYKDVGTKIQVKPSTMPTADQVALDIFLEHSYISKAQSTPPPDDRGTYSYNIETARTRNKVVLKSGQTTMIGGLMVNSYEQVESGIPFLKDIPGIGALFRGRSKAIVDKQLLIFITPTLITPETGGNCQPAWNQQISHEQL